MKIFFIFPENSVEHRNRQDLNYFTCGFNFEVFHPELEHRFYCYRSGTIILSSFSTVTLISLALLGFFFCRKKFQFLICPVSFLDGGLRLQRKITVVTLRNSVFFPKFKCFLCLISSCFVLLDSLSNAIS